jgi:hypothetical protein
MSVALNIKDARTHEMAVKIARLTGTSISKAVAIALEEKLAQLDAERKKAWADWARSLAEGGLPDDFVLERDPSPPREFDW